MSNLDKIKKLRDLSGAGMMDVKKALEATHYDLDAAQEWLRKQGITKAAKKADRIAAEGMSIAKVDHSKGVIIEINSETDFVSKNEKFVHAVNDIANELMHSHIKNEESVEHVKSHLKVHGHTLAETEATLTATIGEKITFRRFAIVNADVVAQYTHSNGRVAVLVGGTGVDAAILKDIAMHAAAMAPKYKSLSDIPASFVAQETATQKELQAQKPDFAKKPANIQENIIKGAVDKQLKELVLEEQEFVKDPSKKIKDLVNQGGKLTAYVRFEVGEGIEKVVTDFAEEVKKAALG